ncbi:MAG TPA: selenocysteine-specific translation elongation factor, partial [Firmicutes bacterium]|nr:selenocysteine-specific translation elongation factor [Bacillota bacterium]
MEAGHAIVGTAGHVDHGKTALIRALTGVNTDRLPEEQARGISIELGFAPLRLPSGRRVGVVDVPGHERFVHHMVAGAAGMDVVILVVAADEGVMPQTREHLDVLSLLGLQRGLVAITKVDLVDPEWLSLVEEEVRASLRGTFLEAAPLVPVSSETGQGLDELVRVLDHILAEVPGRDASGPARLPVDRVFSVTGFGTVVTGTLVSGTLAVGDSVEILPIGPGAGRQVRIRQLQVHGEKVERAAAGQRVAVNLVGVERQQIERGQVLCQPRAFSATRRLAGRLHLLPSAPVFVSGTRVHLHLGTAEVGARVALLDREELSPGQDSLVRIGLEAEVVAARGDRFVIRSWSPPHTVGGGVVIAPHSQHRRYLAAHLKSLQRLERGGPQAEIMDLLDGREPLWTVAQLSARAGLEVDRGKEILGRLQEEGRVVELGGEWWGSR